MELCDRCFKPAYYVQQERDVTLKEIGRIRKDGKSFKLISQREVFENVSTVEHYCQECFMNPVLKVVSRVYD